MGTPGVAVVAASADFGDAGCGATAPPQNVSIQNTGGTAFTFTAVLGRGTDSPYTLQSATGTVGPGATVMYPVTALAIPVPSAVPGNYGDTLTITTDIPGDSAHAVILSQRAQGAILTLNLSNIPFGLTTVQTTKSQNFQITNSGNIPVDVTLVTDDSGFSVSPSTATTVGVAMALIAEAQFAPTDTVARTGQISVTVPSTTPLCAGLPADITVSGTGQNGGVSFDVANVDFGAVDCGTTAADQTLTMTNNGNAPFTWSVELNTSMGYYTLSSSLAGGVLNGSLSAMESVTFTVATLGIPAESSTEPNLYGDGITITTNVIGNSTYTVPILQSARGHILSFDPADVQFGNVPVNQSADATHSVVNLGNAPATITLAGSNPAFVTSPASDVAPANGTLGLVSTFSPGASTTPQTSTVTLTVDATDVACAPLPAALTMGGTGTNGAVTYSPQTVNFGNTPCGTTAASQVVTFTNSGNQNYTITAVLGKTAVGAPFTIAVDPADGIVTADGGMATITITAAGIPAVSETPGDYGDVLTVTTDVSGDTPHEIALSQNAYGAILGAPSSSSISFPTTPVNLSVTSTFAVQNTGNAPATLTFTNTNSAFTFENLVALAGAGANATARFSPLAAMGYSDTATMNVAPGTVICQPLPTMRSISLSGTGTAAAPTVTVSRTTVNFGDTLCGTTNMPQTVTVTNLGNTPVDITSNNLQNGTTDNRKFTVTINRTNLTAAGTATDNATITITPKMVSQDTSTELIQWSDQLTIVTTAPDAGTLTVNLVQQARGAIFVFTPASVNLPYLSNNATFSVQNAGNAAATFDLVNSNNTNFTFVESSGSVAGGTTFAPASRLTRAALNNATTTVAVTRLSGAPLCRPLPAAFFTTTN